MSIANRSKQSPPLGVKIICILYTLLLVFGLIGGALLFSQGDFSMLDLIMYIISGAWMATMIYGLWTLKSWAVIITFGYLIYTSLQAIVTGEFFQIFVAAILAAYVYNKRDYYS